MSADRQLRGIRLGGSGATWPRRVQHGSKKIFPAPFERATRQSQGGSSRVLPALKTTAPSSTKTIDVGVKTPLVAASSCATCSFNSFLAFMRTSSFS